MKRMILLMVAVAGLIFPAAAQEPFLEPPVCGDDTNEYLVEELGESDNSARYDGDYGCTYSKRFCLKRSEGEDKFYEDGAYSNANEDAEERGRYKNDKEYCYKRTVDPYGTWWDQDYGDVDADGAQETCEVNNLYGSQGVRWFTSSYIDDHPRAVEEGIDDDWNQYLEDNNHPNVSSSTPVSTGGPDNSIATKPFCGGDDGSEFLVTQECVSEYCVTDRTVQGVGKVDGSCVIDDESSYTQYDITELPDTGINSRQVFSPGELLTIEDIAKNPKMGCFNGVWYSEWPINFNREKIDVELGSTRTAAFEVINVRDTEATFEINMRPGSDELSASRFSSFEEKEGDSFETTLAPRSSKTFHVEIRGARKNLDDDTLTVAADGVDNDQFGTDSLTVNITDKNISSGVSRSRNVPGIQPLQIVFILLTTMLLFYRSL